MLSCELIHQESLLVGVCLFSGGTKEPANCVCWHDIFSGPVLEGARVWSDHKRPKHKKEAAVSGNLNKLSGSETMCKRQKGVWVIQERSKWVQLFRDGAVLGRFLTRSYDWGMTWGRSELDCRLERSPTWDVEVLKGDSGREVRLWAYEPSERGVKWWTE